MDNNLINNNTLISTISTPMKFDSVVHQNQHSFLLIIGFPF